MTTQSMKREVTRWAAKYRTEDRPWKAGHARKALRAARLALRRRMA